MGLSSTGVRTFLLISFGMTWGTIFVGHFLLGVSLGDPAGQLMLALPMAFSPAIAAIVVRRWVTREGFGDAGLALRLRAARSSYVLAWLGPVLVLAGTVGVAIAVGLYRPDLSFSQLTGAEQLIGAALLLVIPILMMPVYWGEEFGWRGYLQQRVSPDPVRAAMITGVIWSVWHYPLVFTDYADYANRLLGIVSWTLIIMAQAIILAWLFARSGSVWVACLAHAGNNMIIGTLSSTWLAESAGLDSATVNLLQLVPYGAIAGWIVLTGQLRRATGRVIGQPGAQVVGANHAA